MVKPGLWFEAKNHLDNRFTDETKVSFATARST